MTKILAITDMDDNGSGYRNICVPLFTGLAKLGHEIKVAGLMYTGREHNHPFSIIPAQGLQEVEAICINLFQLWKPEILLVALDLPLQAQMFNKLVSFPKKYIAITPLENGPLTMSWAAPLFNMDAVFFISELGKQEALKAGVAKAQHIQIGIDTESMRPALPEERQRLREGLGIPQEAFVVLTVADNQERKNLWAGMEAVSRLKKEIDRPVRYILVTREQSPFGWKLRDLALTLDINQEYVPFERGMPQKDLWGLYAVADAYLQPSKAEGLGLPVLDAMAAGVPVVATDTGALHELLIDDRGHLVEPEYTFTDVWGNSTRHMISIEHAKSCLWLIAMGMNDNSKRMIESALEYVKTRKWDIAVNQVHETIEGLIDEPKTEAQPVE